MTWVPADDGIYAHLGERILSGEILNKDVQSIHPGFINFVNAASLWLFGPQLVSLRFPLVFIGLLQAVIVHLIFSRLNMWVGIVASVSLTVLGFLQVFHPTANWYCHGLFIAIIGVLHWTRPEANWRIFFLGYLIGTIYLFRQLTGVIGGIGLLTYLLMEERPGVKDPRARDLLFARILLGLMGIGMTWYFLSHASVLDFLLFGFCPLVLLAVGLKSTTSKNCETFRIVYQLCGGAFVSLLPLLIYHLIHNSLSPWISDTVFRAIQLSQLPIYSQREYADLIRVSLYTLSHSSGLLPWLNGVYLFLLPLLSLLNGGMLLGALYTSTQDSSKRIFLPALPCLAMFYAVVSMIYPIAIYLYLTMGLSLIGILWQCYESGRARKLGLILTIFLSLVAMAFHAGQPLQRSWQNFMQGEKVALASAQELERLGLKVETVEGAMYSELIEFIKQKTQPKDSIFVFPNNAEVYFLSGRTNPFRFYNLALDVTNAREAQEFIQLLKKTAPALIIVNSSDKYHTEASTLVAEYVRANYSFIKEIDKFEIFSLPQST